MTQNKILGFKTSALEGVVCSSEQQPFLGGYLPYVQVQWDGRTFPIPVEPELLLRLTRFIPPGLTWKAEESFSDLPSTYATVSTHVDEHKVGAVLTVYSLTISTRLDGLESETILTVSRTISTRVDQPESESQAVLMVHPSTVSTPVVDQPTVQAVLTVQESINTYENSASRTVSTYVDESETEAVLTAKSSTLTRRSPGSGTGRIQWRTITKKNGKQYQQPWYDWQIHLDSKTISKSTYISKRLLPKIQELEARKAPVREILKLLEVSPFA